MDEPVSKRNPSLDHSGSEDANEVSLALKGETAAYDRLVERYQRRAVSVAYRLLGNLNDAMDVAQDAFLRGFRSLETLENANRFGPWLMRIVSNLALNFRRGRKKHLSLSLGDDDESVSDNWVPEGDRREVSGDAALESAELRAKIDEAVDSLPEPQRLALVLFAIEQMPQKEVAEIMQCSVEMVKWNVFQARKALKARLAEYLEE